MKHVIQGFAYCQPAQFYEHEYANVIDGFRYNFIHSKIEGVEGLIHVGTATLTIELPEGFDPRAGAVEALQKEKQKLMADFQARMNEIDKQISQYTAIEFAG